MKYSQSHILRIHRTNERNRSTKNVTIFAREKKRFRTSSIVVIHKAIFCILNNRSRVLLYYIACSSKTNKIPRSIVLRLLFSQTQSHSSTPLRNFKKIITRNEHNKHVSDHRVVSPGRIRGEIVLS